MKWAEKLENMADKMELEDDEECEDAWEEFVLREDRLRVGTTQRNQTPRCARHHGVTEFKNYRDLENLTLGFDSAVA